jgi:hypothetical protein
MRITFIAVMLGVLLFSRPSAAQTGRQPKGKAPDKAMPARGSEESSATFGGKTFDQWRAEMKSEDASKRIAATMAILNFGPKIAGNAVPDFIHRLQDRDVGARTKACWALRFVYVDASHVRSVVDALAAHVSPQSESQAIVRYEAAITLLRFVRSAGPVANKVLMGLHDSSSSETRQKCASILWRIGMEGKNGPDPQIVSGLLDWMRYERSYHVRLEILQGLGAMPKPADKALQSRLVADLTTFAGSPNKALAIWAYAGLVSHAEGPTSQRSLSTIARYLSYKDTETKIQAVMALGGLGKKAKNQVPLVLKLLKEDRGNALVVQGACMALSRMADATDKAVVDALLDLLTVIEPPHQAAAAVKALVDLKPNNDRRVIDTLDKMLKSGKLKPELYAWVQSALDELRGVKK